MSDADALRHSAPVHQIGCPSESGDVGFRVSSGTCSYFESDVSYFVTNRRDGALSPHPSELRYSATPSDIAMIHVSIRIRCLRRRNLLLLGGVSLCSAMGLSIGIST